MGEQLKSKKNKPWYDFLLPGDVGVESVEDSMMQDQGAAKSVGQNKAKFRGAVHAGLDAGRFARSKHANALRKHHERTIGAFDNQTRSGEATMRSEAARSLAARQGRGMRGNVSSMLDQGLQSAQMTGKYSMDRSAQREQIASAQLMASGQASIDAADYDVYAAEKGYSVGTADGDYMKKVQYVNSMLPQWRAEAQKLGVDEDEYVQAKLAGMIRSEDDPRAVAEYTRLHNEIY